MSKKPNLMEAALVVAVLSVGWWLFSKWADGRDQPAVTIAKAEVKRDAVVIQEIRLGESESVRVLSVPDPILPGESLLDHRCLIYSNRDRGNMVCLPRADARPPG